MTSSFATSPHLLRSLVPYCFQHQRSSFPMRCPRWKSLLLYKPHDNCCHASQPRDNDTFRSASFATCLTSWILTILGLATAGCEAVAESAAWIVGMVPRYKKASVGIPFHEATLSENGWIFQNFPVWVGDVLVVQPQSQSHPTFCHGCAPSLWATTSHCLAVPAGRSDENMKIYTSEN